MKLMQTIHEYDVFVFCWVMRRKSQKLLVRCARYISKTGDGYLYLILVIGLLVHRKPEHFPLLGCIGLALLLERALYFILKNGFKRDRPPAALNIQSFITPSDRFSFPSGHTSAAFLMATLVSFFYPSLTPFLFAWAAMIGMARVILGVHFPTDTVIGALMGIAVALLSLEFLLE